MQWLESYHSGRKIVCQFRLGAGELFGIGESDVGTEADHAETGGKALTTPERGAVFQFAFDGNSECDDNKIGESVQGDGENAENHELEKDVAAIWRDKLGNEG